MKKDLPTISQRGAGRGLLCNFLNSLVEVAFTHRELRLREGKCQVWDDVAS